MTITFGPYTELVLAVPDVRAIVEVLVIVTLVAVLLQREMLRDRPNLWARAGGAGLTALAVPLTIAWLAFSFQRFLELLL
jgi:hypothetical protein